MFKKVQLKLFAIITSILLAVFIALLASINLIMEAVMQRQSIVVLRQIASSIEYDEKTSSFTYFPEHNNLEPPKHEDRVPVQETTDNTTQQNTQGNTGSSTAPSENPTTGTQPGTSNTAPTEPSTQQTTSATEHTTEPTQDTTVAPEEPATPPFEQDEPLPPPMRPEWPEQLPTDENQQRPEFPWEDDDKNNNNNNNNHWNEHDYDENYDKYWRDDGYYYYPMPDQSINSDEACNDIYCPYCSEGLYKDCPEYEDNTAPTGAVFDEDNISQQSAVGSPSVLNGFTVSKGNSTAEAPLQPAPHKIVYMADSVDMKNPAPVPKSLGSIDFFVIMADQNGNFLASLNNDTLSSDTAQSYISAIMGEKASSGMLNSYQFCSLEKDNGTIMVFTDKTAEMDMLKQLTRTTILIGAVSFVLLSLIAFFLSKKSIQPIKEAFEKQKQFVSDASHELKTPLTIISANADVLSDEIGSNKWLTYIKAQTERMNILVNDLLNLTRLENNTADFICSDFDLSKAVENTALPFECQAFETGKKFVIDVQEGLSLNGSERHVKQMVAIFIDNALKYSDENGTVSVTLTSSGDKKLLSVFNTGQGLRSGEEDKIFERFYRSDDSRARATGGYGLGLAIAKSIIDKHRFKVNIENHEGESICFNILM